MGYGVIQTQGLALNCLTLPAMKNYIDFIKLNKIL